VLQTLSLRFSCSLDLFQSVHGAARLHPGVQESTLYLVACLSANNSGHCSMAFVIRGSQVSRAAAVLFAAGLFVLTWPPGLA
jgi:hypothetical protein